MALDSDLLKLLAMMPAIPPGPVDWEATRKMTAASGAMLAGPAGPPEVSSVEDRSIPGLAGPIALRVYRPVGARSEATLHFMHGGGWTVGGVAEADLAARRLCRDLAVVVISSTYRLAPEHPFPAAYEDALAVAAWVLDHAEELGGDPRRVAIAGDSAGANLAAAVCIGLRDGDDVAKGLSEAGRSRPPLAAQLLFYPCVDLRPSAWTYPSRIADADPGLRRDPTTQTMDAYVQDADASDWRASPLAAADLGGLPPAVIAVCQVDPLYDEAIAYADRLRAAGGEVELIEFQNLIHGFLYIAGIIPAAEAAVEAVLERFAPLIATSR